jgi:sensor histidine kinase YesM
VPKNLYTSGPHVISARVSSYHSPDKLRERYFLIQLGSYENLINNGYRQNLLPITMLGGIIIIGLYFLMMYFLYQRTQQIFLFGLLCVSIALLLLAECYRGLFGYSYDWHLYRLISILLLNALVAGLLLAFFLQRFCLSHQKIWLGTTLALLLLASFSTEGYDGATYLIFLAGLLSSLCVTCVAVKQKKRDAIATCLSLSFVITLMLVFPRQFMDSYLFLSFGLLVLLALASLTLDLRARQKQHEAALLVSARLEIELLKKNIQPHFILNTLTAIEEWIEESPKVAIEFIDALADEFRVMSAMANQKLVPLAQELCLCRSHLEIMGFRTQIKFLLNAVDLNENVMVPPAIFHTLLENAISHNNYRSGSIVFSLSLIEQEDTLVFKFIAPLVGAQHKGAEERLKSQGGTGLRYIKARLEESFSQQWSLCEEAQAAQWITQITIPKSLGINSKVIN